MQIFLLWWFLSMFRFINHCSKASECLGFQRENLTWISGRKFDPLTPQKEEFSFISPPTYPTPTLPKPFPPFPSNTCPKLVGRKYIHSFQDQCCLLFKKNYLTSWPTVEDSNSQRVHFRYGCTLLHLLTRTSINHGPMTLPCGSLWQYLLSC